MAWDAANLVKALLGVLVAVRVLVGVPSEGRDAVGALRWGAEGAKGAMRREQREGGNAKERRQ